MFKKGLVGLGVALMFGCAGNPFGGLFTDNPLENPFVQSILEKCADSPVTEFGECVETELDGADGVAAGEDVTVQQILDALSAIQPQTEDPAE